MMTIVNPDRYFGKPEALCPMIFLLKSNNNITPLNSTDTVIFSFINIYHGNGVGYNYILRELRSEEDGL